MIKIVVFIGPSGAGKSTLQRYLGFDPIVTWTSRLPRSGEQDGKDYFFSSRENIMRMYFEGRLLEYTEYNGNIYGIGIDELQKAAEYDRPTSIVVDINGARELKKRFTSSVLIVGVITPEKECKEHLNNRDDKNNNKRINSYSNEILNLAEVSDLIINNSRANWGLSFKLLDTIRSLVL